MIKWVPRFDPVRFMSIGDRPVLLVCKVDAVLGFREDEVVIRNELFGLIIAF